MNDDNKKQAGIQSSDMAEKAALNDQELAEVSGGFTLFDTCQNRWSPGICAEAIWGICPHLSMTETGKRVGNFNNVIYYKVSCNKGCFKDMDYSDHLSV